METVLLSAGKPSRFIVIKSYAYPDSGIISRDNDGFAIHEENSVFSEMVKIEAERAKVNDRYVNLRFCQSNRYWARDDSYINAESNKPEEDTTKSSCTLFEAISVDDGSGAFYLTHVESGGYVKYESTYRIIVEEFPPSMGPSYRNALTFVDWETLVKLPKQVAFKGYNGKYLQTIRSNWAGEDRPFLQFGANERNTVNTSYDVALMPDGHVRIYSRESTKYWRRDDTITSSGWIWANADDDSIFDDQTLFWPVKIDDTTIALKNQGNNNFCSRNVTSDEKTDCLDAISPTIVNDAKLTVEELVSSRAIHDVRYRLEDARIYNETPFVAGTTSVTNHSDTEGAMAVEVTYEDSKSRSFTRSVSLTAGVSTTIECGIPLIADASIEVSFEINTTMEWNETTTTTTSVTATGSVPVPARTLASISYVGTTGVCDVPFTYTQRDSMSTDGTVIQSDEIDGVFRGVNSYNFSFVIDKTQPVD